MSAAMMPYRNERAEKSRVDEHRLVLARPASGHQEEDGQGDQAEAERDRHGESAPLLWRHQPK